MVFMMRVEKAMKQLEIKIGCLNILVRYTQSVRCWTFECLKTDLQHKYYKILILMDMAKLQPINLQKCNEHEIRH